MRMRTRGIILFATGLLLGGAGIAPVAIEVREGVQRIQVMQSAIVFGIIAMGFALPMILLGERSRVMLNFHQIDLREVRPWVWLVYLGSMALGGLALVLTMGYLREAGYRPAPVASKPITPQNRSVPVNTPIVE
jgi:hypothetical protein